MSFRSRVLLLLMGMAVATTAATVALTLGQANRQVTETATANQREIELITQEISQYARLRVSWDGVETVVGRLAEQTGQRIRLVTESGTTLADSDVLAGRTPRADGPLTALVDPRPPVQIPADDMLRDFDELVPAVADHVDRYRLSKTYAACLSAAGARLAAQATASGIPQIVPADSVQPGLKECKIQLGRTPIDKKRTEGPLAACADDQQPYQCLQRRFTELVYAIAPEPARVFIGAPGEAPPPIAMGPIVAVAVAVALLAIIGGLLLSRRVLRPIGELTRAARRLEEGDLSSRVAIKGRDELTRLGRAFNRMASSLQRGEERQRRLVADVAHELRTPLANLRGYLEALKDGVVPGGPDLFASLHEEALLQQRIVDDLQDLALAEAGALAYHRTWLDLGDLVETVRIAHLARAEAAGIRLTAAGAGAGRAYGDPDRLRQVLGNLVTNALRATGAGGTVALQVQPDRDRVLLTVADNGSGIAPTDVPYVFDRFWRADPARGRSTGGAGLGLAVARQIVTDHSGTIEVESVVGQGTRFTIALPSGTGAGVTGTG